MTSTKRHWIALGLVVLGAFSILGWFGQEVYRQAPPIPERVVTEDGRQIATKDDILSGQQVWQSIGGQQVGSIWGHGAYQAPDWSADWLHREATALLERWSLREHGVRLEQLGTEARGGLEARLRQQLRSNRYDPDTGAITISADRAAAIAEVAVHYDALFGGAPSHHALRTAYALQDQPIPDAARRQALGSFFFWTAWACTTERPAWR